MQGLDPSAWEPFAAGQLGASAALLGLVVVGISINLREVVASPLLVNRAGEAVLLLGGLLVSSTLLLIPDQSTTAAGVELLAVGTVLLGGVGYLQRGLTSRPDGDGDRAGPAPRSSVVTRRLLGLGAGALMVIAGVTLLADAGGGLNWWAAAVVVAYLGALANTWVLLIEILR
jgi:modulator of FtsH protease